MSRKISDETKAACVKAVAVNAWRDMTRDMTGVKPLEQLPESMLNPMLEQVEVTLAPIWPIIESETP